MFTQYFLNVCLNVALHQLGDLLCCISIFGENGKWSCGNLIFAHDLTISWVCLGQQSTSIPWGWQWYLWMGAKSASVAIVGFLVRMAVSGGCFVLFYWGHFLQSGCLLTISTTCLRNQSMHLLMRMTTVAIPLDGRRVGDSCRNRSSFENAKGDLLVCGSKVFYYHIPTNTYPKVDFLPP